MSKRALGPAIVHDMIEYIGDRYQTRARKDQDTATQLLAEAFLLYAVPQLDALDQATIVGIYGELQRHFKEAAKDRGILPRIRQLYPFVPDGCWPPDPAPAGK